MESITLSLIILFLWPICVGSCATQSSTTSSSTSSSSSVADKFKQIELVPDVVRKAPTQALDVKYGSVKVDYGNVLTIPQVKNPPTEIRWLADPNSMYTLIMTDPDMHGRQGLKLGEFEHWMVANIPGDKVEKGETWTEYIGSSPPKGSGQHRYAFLVYRQPRGKIQDPQHGYKLITSIAERSNWRAEEFATTNNLEGPIAGNFFQCEYRE